MTQSNCTQKGSVSWESKMSKSTLRKYFSLKKGHLSSYFIENEILYANKFRQSICDYERGIIQNQLFLYTEIE